MTAGDAVVAQQELTEKVRSRLIKTVQILAAGRGENLSEWGTSGVIVDLKGSGFGFIRPDTGKVNDKDLFCMHLQHDNKCQWP
eukprot:g28454.t1